MRGNEAGRHADAIAALRDRRERAAALAESLTDEIDRRPSTQLRGKLDRLAALIDALDAMLARGGPP